jgi:hypothetical protein
MKTIKLLALLLSASALSVLFLSPLHAQSKQEDIFSLVPAESRATFLLRLNSFLEAVYKGDAGTVYDMTFGPAKNKLTREQYVKLAKNSGQPKLVAFTPLSIDKQIATVYAGADWRIIGEAKLEYPEDDSVLSDAYNREARDAMVYVQRRDENWYFILVTQQLKTNDGTRKTRPW